MCEYLHYIHEYKYRWGIFLYFCITHVSARVSACVCMQPCATVFVYVNGFIYLIARIWENVFKAYFAIWLLFKFIIRWSATTASFTLHPLNVLLILYFLPSYYKSHVWLYFLLMTTNYKINKQQCVKFDHESMIHL